MNSIAGKNILIVGASGAFGREFANQLIENGATVFGTARNAETSVRLAVNLHGRFLLNLEEAGSITALTEYLKAHAEPLDGIILASGLVAFGKIEQTPTIISERLMRVNALGQIQLIQELLPKLAEASSSDRKPFVLSLSGAITEFPMAELAAYTASKFAIRGFGQAAGKEFRKLGIAWIDARPGHTESGLSSRAIFGQAPNFGEGKEVGAVVARIIHGIVSGETDFPSSVF